MNNPANCMFGNGTVRLSTTLPADDGTNITGVSAATDTLTHNAHGYGLGRKLKYVSGTGFTGLEAGVTYFVIPATANTFKLAATRALAVAGTALTLGTSSAGVFTPTGLRALPESYPVEFGNIDKFGIKPASEKKEHWGSYKGVRKRDLRRRSKSSLTYEVTVDELPQATWALLMGAASGEAPDPGRLVDYYGIAFVEQENEPIQPDGTAIYNHHGFKCQVGIEDSTLDLDGETPGSVKFGVDVDLGTPGLYIAGSRPIA